MKKIMLYGSFIGLLSGTVLGLFLKWIESVRGTKVYTLLLNIDFFPGVKEKLAEPVEFAIHLVVSVLIATVFFWWLAYGARYIQLQAKWFQPFLASVLYGVLPITLFVPLTLISDRTPEITDMAALIWWTIGHLIYAILLYLFGKKYLKIS
jgi:hypothetical protein